MTTLYNDYLELIELTELLLLQKLPKKTSIKHNQLPQKPAQEPPKPILKREEPLKKPLITTPPIEEKKPIKIEKKQKTDAHDLGSVLDLIKNHCTHVKLLEEPTALNPKILILIDPEMDVQKEVFEKMALALNKSKIECQIIEIEKCTSFLLLDTSLKAIVITKKSLLAHPSLHTHAKRDLNGQPLIGKTRLAIINDLQAIIDEPNLKREFWNLLLQLCQTP